MALEIKSPQEVQAIAAAGRVLDTIIEDVILREVKPGVTTAEVEARVHDMILARGGEPVFRGYTQTGSGGGGTGGVGGGSGGVSFSGSACVCVNEEVVHAVPSTRIVREGDLLTVDVAMRYRGWCIDTAWSVAVRGVATGSTGDNAGGQAKSGRAEALQAAAADVLRTAREMMQPGVRWSTIAATCQKLVASRGMHFVHGYCGHGIGRQLHESPRVSFTSKDWSKAGEDFTLWPGMVLCVEPIVCEGLEPSGLTTLDDGWTVITNDRRWTAHEEECVVVTVEGARVLAGAGQY